MARSPIKCTNKRHISYYNKCMHDHQPSSLIRVEGHAIDYQDSAVWQTSHGKAGILGWQCRLHRKQTFPLPNTPPPMLEGCVILKNNGGYGITSSHRWGENKNAAPLILHKRKSFFPPSARRVKVSLRCTCKEHLWAKGTSKRGGGFQPFLPSWCSPSNLPRGASHKASEQIVRGWGDGSKRVKVEKPCSASLMQLKIQLWMLSTNVRVYEMLRTFSITAGIASKLLGLAENLLYSLQASTWNENKHMIPL